MDENQRRAALFQGPSAIPSVVSVLPATWMKYREELSAVVARHPSVFPDGSPRDYDAVGGTYVAGEHVDAWGCTWSSIKTGMDSIVTGHAAPTRESVHTLASPKEDIGFPHGFMFLRLTDLRGFEEAMMDFAEEPPELQMLIDLVLDYNLRQARILLGKLNEPQFVWFGDDLGMQASLPISPEKWRRYLKPCFEAIYRPFVERGHLVNMHTDGHIVEIIPDLVDCGVKVINPQVRANGIDNLARVARGKVCLNLDLDRQMFPFGSPNDIREHVRECVAKLATPQGGLWLVAEVADDVPLENIEAIAGALEEASRFRA